MLSKLRADWRRGRASKYIRPGERWTFEYKTRAGPIILVGRFEVEDETLILVFREIYAKDVFDRGKYRADVGLASVRGFLEWVAGMASELGYTRMRVEGTRTTRKRRGAGRQRFEFDLGQYLRGSGSAR